MSNRDRQGFSRVLNTFWPVVLGVAACQTDSPAPHPQTPAQPAAVVGQPARRQVVAAQAARTAKPEPAPRLSCKGRGTLVLVDLDARRLMLCRNDEAEHVYPVSLGSNGIGKRKEGDRRTPIGDYPLGQPRISTEFGPFVPIGYPTKAQVKAGFTGRDVGIHAPHRQDRDKGALNTAGNWTAGCLSLGSDAEAAEIAQFVRERRPRKVALETARRMDR